jgi:hypothetical protein
VPAATRRRGRSGDELVLVDETTEEISSADRSRRVADRGRLWRGELETTVGPSMVVVAHVLGEHRSQVASGEHQDMVEAVLPDRAHPTLGERVRPG